MLLSNLLDLDDQLPILREPILPRRDMVKQRLGAVVRLPNAGVIAVEGGPIREIPLCDKSIKRSDIPNQIINVGLLILPQLGRGMLTEGVG